MIHIFFLKWKISSSTYYVSSVKLFSNFTFYNLYFIAQNIFTENIYVYINISNTIKGRLICIQSLQILVSYTQHCFKDNNILCHFTQLILYKLQTLINHKSNSKCIYLCVKNVVYRNKASVLRFRI